jgi:hypothetical protein
VPFSNFWTPLQSLMATDPTIILTNSNLKTTFRMFFMIFDSLWYKFKLFSTLFSYERWC